MAAPILNHNPNQQAHAEAAKVQSAPTVAAQPQLCPLLNEGWLEYNRQKWGVRTERVAIQLEGAPATTIDGWLFLNQRGKVFHPRTVPYHPLTVKQCVGGGAFNHYREWLEAADKLVEEIRRRNLSNPLILPPEIVDVRPWQWANYLSEVRYTLYIDFPFDPRQSAHHSVLRNMKKAAKEGFTCERSSDMRHVLSCLEHTMERQGFDYRLTVDDLMLARSLMGEDTFRTYVCYSPKAEPVASVVILHTSGSRAIYWVAGMKPGAGYGWTEMIHDFVFRDLQQAAASGLDFVGANIRTVAAAKAKWGVRVVPFYVVETRLRSSLSWLYHWARRSKR